MVEEETTDSVEDLVEELDAHIVRVEEPRVVLRQVMVIRVVTIIILKKLSLYHITVVNNKQ